MLSTAQGPRRLGAALLAALMTVVVAACGGNTATSAAPATASAPAASQPARRTRRVPASRRQRARPATRGPPVTIKYSIWGDPQEITNQTAIADAFHAANPAITVDVDVVGLGRLLDDKLQTGLAGGAAPDVFAMDGPLFPDYQARDVLLDLKPLHRHATATT